MRQCTIADLRPGMVLGLPLYAYYGGKRTLLLGVSAKLGTRLIGRLESIGYSFVYVEEDGTEKVIPEDVLSDESRDTSLLAISQYYDEVNSSVKDLTLNSQKPIDIKALNINLPNIAPLRETVKDVIKELFIIGSVKAYHGISGISRSNAIHNHVLNVAVLSLLIGNEFGYVDSEQTVLGMGALLHDIGKSALPGIYEKRHWELDDSDQENMRQHPLLGEKLLRNSLAITEAERQIIIQHHERQDGSGYPYGLEGDNTVPLRTHFVKPKHIFRFAEIVAVADMFDNLVSGNYYSHRVTPEEALNELFRETGKGFNKEIVRAVSGLITSYPVGSMVTIEKHPDSRLVGSKGVVSKSDSKDSDIVEILILYDSNGERIEAERLAVDLERDDKIELAGSQ